jgi:putative transposase
MAHTSTHNYLHIVFGTKDRNSLIPELMQPDLWKYMAGICRNLRMTPFDINGMEDHSHLVVRLPPVIALAEAVKVIKSNSSRWMGEHGRQFGWQGGYGAFSVSASNLAAVRKYVREQKIHHRKMTFEQEFRELLRRHGDDPDFVPPRKRGSVDS